MNKEKVEKSFDRKSQKFQGVSVIIANELGSRIRSHDVVIGVGC